MRRWRLSTAVSLGTNFPDAVQGWYVPRYVIEGDDARGIEPIAPELNFVSDLKEHWELFRDPEQPGKGRFYNCILGWSCEEQSTRKLEGYGLDRFYTNFRPGTGAALAAAIASAYERGRPVLALLLGPDMGARRLRSREAGGTALLGRSLGRLQRRSGKQSAGCLSDRRGHHRRECEFRGGSAGDRIVPARL